MESVGNDNPADQSRSQISSTCDFSSELVNNLNYPYLQKDPVEYAALRAIYSTHYKSVGFTRQGVFLTRKVALWLFFKDFAAFCICCDDKGDRVVTI